MTEPQPQIAPTPVEPEASAFKGLLQVLAWLRDQGYALAQSTIYKHRERGLLLPDSTGAFSRKAVEKYARDHLRKPGQAKDQVSGETAEKKTRDEARLIKARADLVEQTLAQRAGELVPRDFAVAELTKRALVLKHDLHNLAVAQARPLIKAAQGDPVRAPEVIELLQAAFDELLDRYAQGASLAPPLPALDGGAEGEEEA
jgi:hypothetical protein